MSFMNNLSASILHQSTKAPSSMSPCSGSDTICTDAATWWTMWYVGVILVLILVCISGAICCYYRRYGRCGRRSSAEDPNAEDAAGVDNTAQQSSPDARGRPISDDNLPPPYSLGIFMTTTNDSNGDKFLMAPPSYQDALSILEASKNEGQVNNAFSDIAESTTTISTDKPNEESASSSSTDDTEKTESRTDINTDSQTPENRTSIAIAQNTAERQNDLEVVVRPPSEEIHDDTSGKVQQEVVTMQV